MVKINGTACDAAKQTLRAYLASAGYDEKRVAVERNGAIVPKSAYAETLLEHGY